MVYDAAVSGRDDWWEEGETIALRFGDGEWDIFVRRMGSGPSMTLLHGFPSSSHDWAKIAPRLAESHALLMPDFLGFGGSARPENREYSIHEQADLVEALWRHEGVEATIVVAHDYAVSVTQELLARRAEGGLGVELERVVLLNGGLYPDLHRPEPVQVALLDPEQGPQVNAALTEELLIAAAKPTFGDGYDYESDAADIWAANARGPMIWHRLIRYILDRREHEERWVRALETTDVPLAFAWGMLDPVSGAHMAERIRARLPDAQFTALDDVGHWPPLEAPDRVLGAIEIAVRP